LPSGCRLMGKIKCKIKVPVKSFLSSNRQNVKQMNSIGVYILNKKGLGFVNKFNNY